MKVVAYVTRLSQGQEVNFENLPVAKITHYPLEKGSYKPYAQCSFCITDEAYVLRMMAFEAVATHKSCLVAVLYPYVGNTKKRLHIEATPAGSFSVLAWLEDTGKEIPIEVQAFHREGEDLQGIYWGWDIYIPTKELKKYGELTTEHGESFPGNYYKIQEIEPKHYGSFAVADFTKEDFYAIDNMAEFNIVAY